MVAGGPMCRNTHDDCSLLSMCRVEQPKTHAPRFFQITARTNGGSGLCVCVLEEVIPRRPRYQRAVSRGYFFCYARRAEHRRWAPLPSWLRWLKGRLQNHGNSVSIDEKCSPQSLSRAATACEATTSSLVCRQPVSVFRSI